MKKIAVFFFFVCLTSHLRSQTDDEKFLLERAKKTVLATSSKNLTIHMFANLNNASLLLLEDKNGKAWLEDRIVEFGNAKNDARWAVCISVYWVDCMKRFKAIPAKAEDVPDKMIPQFVNHMSKTRLSVHELEFIGNFEKRGVPFIPLLEKIRDTDKNDAFALAAHKAIITINATLKK